MQTVKLRWSKLRIFLTGITAIATFSLAVIGLVVNIPDFCKNISPYVKNIPVLDRCIGSPINLYFNSPSLISIGDEVELIYTIGRQGYYSLWNKNRAGNIKRVFPEPNKNNRAIENQENFKKIQYFMADKEASEEIMILLWTPSNPQHPDKLIYPNESSFNQYIKAHKNYDFKKKVASIQVK